MPAETALVIVDTATRIVKEVRTLQTVATANPAIAADETGYDVAAATVRDGNVRAGITAFDGIAFTNPAHDYTGEVIAGLLSAKAQYDRWQLDSAVYPAIVQTNVGLWMAAAHIVADKIYQASNITSELKVKIYSSLEDGAADVGSVQDYYSNIRVFGAPTFLPSWANLITGERVNLQASFNLGAPPNPLVYDRFTTVHKQTDGTIILPGQGDALTWTVPA